LIGEINSNTDVRSELYEYNLIICPGYFETAPDLLNLSLVINEEAFVIADTPFTLSPEATATWALTNQRQYSQDIAYYYPHSLAANLDGTLVFAAASGTALKTIAYSDSISEEWYPPAGFRRGVVVGVSDVGYVTGTLGTATTFVSTPLNQGQRDNLYQYNNNINIIPFFPGQGIVVFGQKTSASVASALDRINVMRLLMKIKRDIRKASYSFLFELNDVTTRDAIKAMIDSYLNDILLRRGLYDYVVICSEVNNPPSAIQANELHVDIALSPELAVEFIYIPITVVSYGTALGAT
jgi:phage tail sheath protein FI